MGRRRKNPIFAAHCAGCGRGIEAGRRVSVVATGKLTTALDLEKKDVPLYFHQECMKGLLDPRAAALKRVRAVAKSTTVHLEPSAVPED